jgi:Domain of unknown function (DUF1707)
MDTQLKNNQRGAIRVSDAERDQAAAELGEHYQAGRLTLEEFDERSSRALRARTGSDLVGLFADLPTTAAPAAMTTAGVAAPAGAAGGWPVVRVVLACVIAASIVGNIAGGFGHHGLGWLVPVVVLGLVFLRPSRHR